MNDRIQELTAADVAGPGQRHFFAGIACWSHALRLAGVADDADVWTGSCPCQPFSNAGARGGVRDARHLWPAWRALVEECRPRVLFGEQVASIDGLAWLDVVLADLERCGYAVGASDLCAAGVGAPHIRQRLYFVAHHVGDRLEEREPAGATPWAARGRGVLGDTGRDGDREHAGELPRDESERALRSADGDHASIVAGAACDPWTPCDWIECADGYRRPVGPGTFPLAHGAPSRVGRLRAYGNAIVPQVAAAFIRAALGAVG